MPWDQFPKETAVSSLGGRLFQANQITTAVLDRVRLARSNYLKVDPCAGWAQRKYGDAIRDGRYELESQVEWLEKQRAQMLEAIKDAIAEMQEANPQWPDLTDQLLDPAQEIFDLLAGGTPKRVLFARISGILASVEMLRNAWNNLNKFAETNLAIDVVKTRNDFVERQTREVEAARMLAEAFRTALRELDGLSEELERIKKDCGPRDESARNVPRISGDEVAKKVADKETGRALDGTIIKLPDLADAGGPDRAEVRVVERDEPIRPDGEYLVDAACHQSVKVSGTDLIGGVRLQHRRKTLFISPCTMPGARTTMRDEAGGGKFADRLADMLRKHTSATSARRAADEIGRLGIQARPGDVSLTAIDGGCSLVIDNWWPTDGSGGSGRTADAAGGLCDQPGRPPGDRAGGPPSDRADGPATDRTGPPSIGPLDAADAGFPDAADDPSVDEPADPPSIPVVEFDLTRRIQQTASGGLADDPHFFARGSWGQPYADQWGLHRIGLGPESGRGPALWRGPGRPVVVAVVDTGVDRLHPDLAGALWINGGEIPGNGKDDDGNGFVDDVHGWNFVHGDADVHDVSGHGTVVAGIVAAGVRDGLGIAGVNPWARIMALKAVEWNGDGWASDVAAAITYAADNGASVINVSIGGRTLSRREYQAVLHARRRGAVVVAAAGNEGLDVRSFSPAGLPGVVTVAATDPEDRRVGYSGWGAGVDVAAPGVDILSTRAHGTDLLKFERGSYRPGTAFVGDPARYYRVTGTSFAAPFVSGAISLVLSTRPDVTPTQAARMVLHSARDVDVPGWDQFTGYGLLDVPAALRADPASYLIARILEVSGVRVDGRFAIQVSGRARADAFGRAWIEIGQGTRPTEWVRVSDDITRPVDRGVLALVPPHLLRGSNLWTLRLIVEHRNGTRREARFELKLG